MNHALPILRLARRARHARAPLLLGVLLLVAAGCRGGPTDFGTERPLSAGKADPAYVLTVPLESGDTVAALERDFGGRVLVWQPDGFALVGLEDAPAPRLDSGTLAAQSTSDGVEANDERFFAGATLAWMSGSSYVWGGGSSYVWGGGSSYVWGGGSGELWENGQYEWMPENTSIWQQVGLEEGHALATRLGYGIKIAVIDGGVDLQHPALVEALAPEEEWWDFYADDPLPQEEGAVGDAGYGHGTSVAGIVRQVAPRATILPLRVLGPDGGGNVVDVAAAIAWAVDMGAEVVNLSLGSAGTSQAVEAAIADATARGALVVSSTGNSGDTAVTYPAASAVGQDIGWQRLSVTSVDGNDDKSEFATYGEAVELAAPGEDVYGPAPGERTSAWSGTSMAAPMASGALALALGEPLKLPRTDLANELRHRAYHDIYNNRNREYQDLLGRGRLDLVEFLRNVVDR